MSNFDLVDVEFGNLQSQSHVVNGSDEAESSIGNRQSSGVLGVPLWFRNPKLDVESCDPLHLLVSCKALELTELMHLEIDVYWLSSAVVLNHAREESVQSSRSQKVVEH